MRLTALGAASAALPACGGDGDTSPGGDEKSPRVVVVGAGLAGLHAAYRLKQAGIDVTVYEATDRVGGRTFTLHDFPDDQLGELGGELIDTNHPAMFALAEEFELTLDDRLAEPVTTNETWWIGGVAVPEETIVEQFSAVAGVMLDDLDAADTDDARFAELDETPLSDYLDAVVPAADYPELHAVLTAAYRGEFGLETPEQSALNLIYLIGSDEPDPFRVFGESDERYHLHEGSDSIALSLAEELGDAVALSHALVSLAADGDGYSLLFTRTDAEPITVEAEHVVLAIPFTVARTLDLALDVSDDKRRIIDELGYGTNAKVMGAFNERVWRTQHDASGSVTTDAAFQQTWDSSIGQAGEHGILTNFLGGEGGLAVGGPEPEAHFQSVIAELENVFPGIGAAYVEGSARRMHWPNASFTRGSYTCYRPGQWSFWQLEGERAGNVHFCGEHTSPDFQGWMEGAAETGAFVAAEVLNDLGVAYPDGLRAILEGKLPQPTWGLDDGAFARVSPIARRRALAARAVRG
ncbi:MAG TPA: FAD-dependent oxidoreductase [Polyangiaceae bacterium]